MFKLKCFQIENLKAKIFNYQRLKEFKMEKKDESKCVKWTDYSNNLNNVGKEVPATGANLDCSAEAFVKSLLAWLYVMIRVQGPEAVLIKRLNLLKEVCIENGRLVSANLRLYVARMWGEAEGKKFPKVTNFAKKMENLTDINSVLDQGSDIFFIGLCILFDFEIKALQVDFKCDKIKKITTYCKKNGPVLKIINDLEGENGAGTHFWGFVDKDDISFLTNSFKEKLFKPVDEFNKYVKNGNWLDEEFDDELWQKNLYSLYDDIVKSIKFE
jgi:hypothetical protein